MKVMILAAGRGERMGNLTQNCPKPLLMVKGKCLIDWHLIKLCEAGFKDVVINVAYLSKEIIEFVGNGSKWGLNISISEEEQALETAGGIKQAIKYLGDEPFAVINADIFSDYNYKNLKNRSLQKKSLAHLVLINNPEHNLKGDFGIMDDGILTMNSERPLTFSGIAIYDPKFFSKLKEGNKIKLAPILEIAINNKCIQGELFEGAWSDVGTPERLKMINLDG
jgi:N-acetyl-alpha-D-muramate 1-phosphate uridylyltransferase